MAETESSAKTLRIVFASSLDTPSSYRDFYEWWKRVETAGVRDRKPHAMRRTFATEVLDATEGDLSALKGTTRAFVHARHRGLPPLLAHAHGLGYGALAVYRGAKREDASRRKRHFASCRLAGKRRRADSNRCTRLCRPLPNLSATAPERRIVAVLPAA
jgi:hypothetical protein